MTARDSKRCDIQIEPGRAIKLIPEPNREHLNDQQALDYSEHRWAFIQWLRREGKNPQTVSGYSDYTVYETAYKTARYDRYVWSEEERYTIPPTPDHATEYMDAVVAYRDVATATKGKTEEALMRYHRWAHTTTSAPQWRREQRFRSGGTDAPRDYLSRRERRLVREQALETGNGWKVPSLVMVSLDAGLRPVEVNRARTGWVDIDNKMLRIPAEDASKNRDNWRVPVTSRTAAALSEWLDERSEHGKYDDTDALWLTRNATTYSSRSLARLLRRLCDRAGIGLGGRSMTWYSIRHSTATHMVEERDLKAAKDQLRHQAAQTTMKYDQVSPDRRRDALDNM